MKKTPLRPSSSPIRANRTRKAKEFARAYHSVERVEWVKSLPCVVVAGNHAGQIENAHIANGGMGRKADYRKVVPLCRQHHRTLHIRGTGWFWETFFVDLRAAAEHTEALWRMTHG